MSADFGTEFWPDPEFRGGKFLGAESAHFASRVCYASGPDLNPDSPLTAVASGTRARSKKAQNPEQEGTEPLSVWQVLLHTGRNPSTFSALLMIVGLLECKTAGMSKTAARRVSPACNVGLCLVSRFSYEQEWDRCTRGLNVKSRKMPQTLK